MKKLALASVALAGVAAFGAGDAFASGITFYTSYASFAASGESVNDSLDFGLLTGLGGGISGPVTPTITTAGGAQTFSHLSQSGKNTVLGSFLANSLPSALAVAYQTPGHILGFSTGAALYGEGAGTLKISFLHPVVAFEALLAPGSTNFTNNAPFDVKATAYPGGKTASYMGTFMSSTACGATSNCTFIGATAVGGGITGFEVALTDGPLQPAINDFQFQNPRKPIPEPASLGVLGLGLVGLAAFRRRRRPRDPGGGSRWSPFGRWRVAGHPPDSSTS